MNSQDRSYQQKEYNTLRQKEITPIEAVIELGFSEHIADSVAKRMECKYQEALKNGDILIVKYKRTNDPMKFLLNVMNDDEQPEAVRVKVAFNLLPYKHARKTVVQVGVGKKEQQKKDAHTTSTEGKFSSAKAPTNLKAVK